MLLPGAAIQSGAALQLPPQLPLFPLTGVGTDVASTRAPVVPPVPPPAPLAPPNSLTQLQTQMQMLAGSSAAMTNMHSLQSAFGAGAATSVAQQAEMMMLPRAVMQPGTSLQLPAQVPVFPLTGVDTELTNANTASSPNSLTQLQTQMQMLAGSGAMDPSQQEMIIKMAMEMRSKMPKKKKGQKGRAELEKLMAMVQSSQQVPSISGPGLPDSEEEIKMMQMQMQMQMQAQKEIEAGKDPMTAIEASCGPQGLMRNGKLPAPDDQPAQENSQASPSAGKEMLALPSTVALPDKTSLSQAADDGDPTCDLLMYALAQVAEESAQVAVSASSFCCNQAASDPAQVQALSESAQQASQKASWAAQTMETYDPAPGVKPSWIVNMRQIGNAAAKAAQHAAEECGRLANKSAGLDDDDDGEGGKGDGKRGGKVPCKFFLLGKCWKGEGCEFAHEQPELKPRPLMLKREEECIYYARGQCTRGVACPFAHGPEELAEISRYVVTLKKEKQQLMRHRRN